MFTRRLLFPAVLSLWVLLLLGLAQFERGEGQDRSRDYAPVQAKHQKLIEFLDQVVLQEQYYRSLHGQYTKMLNRLSLVPGEDLVREYEFFVTRADQDRLEVIASSERVNGREERVSIDQDYQLHANFPLPPPRPEWLKLQAARVLRQAFYGGLKEAPPESGIYQGYFRYEPKQRNPKLILVAVGVKSPVEGQKVTLEDANALLAAQTETESSHFGSRQEEWSEILLAQKIHWGEKGRYGQTVDELRPYLSETILSMLEDPKTGAEFQKAVLATRQSVEGINTDWNKGAMNRTPASGSLLIEPISEELEIEKVHE